MRIASIFSSNSQQEIKNVKAKMLLKMNYPVLHIHAITASLQLEAFTHVRWQTFIHTHFGTETNTNFFSFSSIVQKLWIAFFITEKCIIYNCANIVYFQSLIAGCDTTETFLDQQTEVSLLMNRSAQWRSNIQVAKNNKLNTFWSGRGIPPQKSDLISE